MRILTTHNLKGEAISSMPSVMCIKNILTNTWLMLILLIAINALYDNISTSIISNGFLYSLATTFNISILIWISFIYAIYLLFQSNISLTSKYDYTILALSFFICLVPDSRIAWLALTIVALYLKFKFRPIYRVDKASNILLGLALIGLWSKIIMRIFIDRILYLDTYFVSTLTNLRHVDNLIFTGNNGVTIEIGEECSAFQNITLVILTWIVFQAAYDARGLTRTLAACMASALAVITINTIRIGVIAWDPSLYELAHGPVGATVAGNLTAISVCMICYFGATYKNAEV